MTPLERFALDNQLTRSVSREFRRLANDCQRLGVAVCNGDPHPRNPKPADKGENCELWQADLDATAAKLATLAKRHGFDGIQFPGLWPSLKKDSRDVYIP
jgi:hypothetical protein